MQYYPYLEETEGWICPSSYKKLLVDLWFKHKSAENKVRGYNYSIFQDK
jgi:hypothetical protein